MCRPAGINIALVSATTSSDATTYWMARKAPTLGVDVRENPWEVVDVAGLKGGRAGTI